MRFLIGLAIAWIAAGQSSTPPAAEWHTYGKNFAGWRYAEQSQITKENISRLKPQWIFQTQVGGKNETTPLIKDGRMYITGPSNNAWALDLATGRQLWHYFKPMPGGANGCCGPVNRGFAVAGDTLFKVNFESTLTAIDSRTGKELWETTISDYKVGYSTTLAPLAVKNLILVGVAGAEFGTRGFLDAYDAKTGKRVWRFWTVPEPGEPGGKTWPGGSEAWKRGGGSIWITGTYDPATNLTYWGTGNPGPDFYGDDRPGDNLYTCALIALDADTGKLKWHFQYTPHDVHDWDAISDPVLVDIEHQGKPVKAVVQANRNGFYYALERSSGKFLFAKPYTKVTWADGIGPDGRPQMVSGQEPTEEGNLSCPGIGGGHNWQATAYSPKSKLYYFNSTDGCQLYFKTKQEFIEGAWYQGSTTQGLSQEPSEGSVIAIDPSTGTTKWRWPMVSPPSGGILATGGGLVFTGDREGYFIALDADTGKVLWKFQTGGTIIAPPVSYEFKGKQYIAIAAGQSIFTFGLP